LQQKTGEQHDPSDGRDPALGGDPELHRQRHRRDTDEDGRARRLRRDPRTLEDDRHRNQQCGEVRAAAEREAARSRKAVPRVDERALLGGGDRTMLGTVETKRPAAQHQREEDDDRHRKRPRPVRARNRDQRQRRQQRRQ
jgi:hypothetical protein